MRSQGLYTWVGTPAKVTGVETSRALPMNIGMLWGALTVLRTPAAVQLAAPRLLQMVCRVITSENSSALYSLRIVPCWYSFRADTKICCCGLTLAKSRLGTTSDFLTAAGLSSWSYDVP